MITYCDETCDQKGNEIPVVLVLVLVLDVNTNNKTLNEMHNVT